MVKEQSKYQKWPALLALTMLMLIMTSCAGGRPGRATATPLPPGDPIAQPSPVFAVPTPAAPPTATTDATSSDSVQALLATRIAEQSEPTALPTSSPTTAPTQTSVAVESLVRRALGDDPLTQPTSLAIVSGDGAGFFATPGGGLIQSLPAGITLTVTGRSGDGAWYAVYLADGRSGWVGTGAVRIFGDPQELVTVSESYSPAIVATLIAEAQRPVTPIPTRAVSTPTPGASGTSDLAAPSPTIAPTALAESRGRRRWSSGYRHCGRSKCTRRARHRFLFSRCVDAKCPGTRFRAQRVLRLVAHPDPTRSGLDLCNTGRSQCAGGGPACLHGLNFRHPVSLTSSLLWHRIGN